MEFEEQGHGEGLEGDGSGPMRRRGEAEPPITDKGLQGYAEKCQGVGIGRERTMPKKRRISLRVDVPIHDRLKEIAVEEYADASALIREGMRRVISARADRGKDAASRGRQVAKLATKRAEK